jgi:hypothetical protein
MRFLSFVLSRAAFPALVALATTACGAGVRPVTAPVPAPETADITASLILLGDAGDPDPVEEPVFQALSANIAAREVETMVVFLGDNLYPVGLPASTAPHRAEAESWLAAQVDAVLQTHARGIMVPGNHDWAKGADAGLAAVRRQGAYVDARGKGQVEFLPRGGCPGPEVRDVGQSIRVIAIDTQWWFHGGPKAPDSVSSCPARTWAETLDSLSAALASAGSRHVAIVAHHPIRSTGPHGGHFPWTDHIFPLRAWKKWLWLPLPIIGSIYPLSRKWGISSQDESSGRYQELVDGLELVFAEYSPLLYAAGHEHVLEVLEGQAARYLLVSGAGTYGHANQVGWRDETRFAAPENGFMRVDVLESNEVRLGVWVVEATGQAEEAFSMWLE